MIKKINPAIFLLILLLIIVDQFSKYLVRHPLFSRDGFYICNKGISFGVSVPSIIFWSVWLIIIVSILLYVFKKKSYILPFSFIISGGISNAIDRLVFGCVIDFIDFKFWPVFNFADAFITIGAIMIIAKNFKHKTKIKTNK